MIVYRLAKAKYSSDLTGKGAEKTGGRWNSKGTSLLYTSESRALCTAEIAVHTPLGSVPNDYVMISIEIPDDASITQVGFEELQEDWKTFPNSHATQEIGDRFVADNLALVLKVPSAIVQGNFNFLVNPQHPDSRKISIIEIVNFEFNTRMFVN
ncbi:MAG: RES family NAD+ phosphorylase [Bacteroidales bacterium]|nr:RES family NAD+ phosphorylase [Bacteroidales bacterium]